MVLHSFLQYIEVSGFCGMHIPRRPANTSRRVWPLDKKRRSNKQHGESGNLKRLCFKKSAFKNKSFLPKIGKFGKEGMNFKVNPFTKKRDDYRLHFRTF